MLSHALKGLIVHFTDLWDSHADTDFSHLCYLVGENYTSNPAWYKRLKLFFKT